jgi:hypothetical protein
MDAQFGGTYGGNNQLLQHLHTNRCCRIFLINNLKKNELENLEHNGYHFQPFERLQVILVLDPACALLSKISW